MKRNALLLAVFPLLAAAAVFADDMTPVVETLADLQAASPAWVYQQLRAQPGVAVNSPKTLTEVLRRTGHSPMKALRLLKIQARASSQPLQLPWVDDELVSTARAKIEARRDAVRSSLQVRITRGLSTSQAADVLRECYRASLHDLADALIRGRDDVVRFDQLPEDVTLVPSYSRGQCSITVMRESASTALAVAVPPGTLSQPNGSGSQDLALLEPAVVELAAWSTQGSVQVATACAGYGFSSPSSRYDYTLKGCAPGSSLDLLLKRVCTTPYADAPSQLAVWIAADNVGSVRFGETVTFRGAKVGREHVEAAAKLLIESGVDPREQNLFGGSDAKADASP
jgi:hypothetical protein